MKLRQYCKYYGMLFLVGFFCSVCYSQSSKVLSHRYHVIIIGAGMSGLSAAAYFQEHGIKNFVVLEGRDRIGGRTWSYQPDKAAWGQAGLDMGAAWIHGAGGKNPIMDLVKKYRVATVRSDNDSYILYDQNYHSMSENPYKKISRKFYNYLEYWQEEDAIHSKRSVSDILKKFVGLRKLNRTQQAGLLYEVASDIENEYAADITRLSMVWFNDDQEYHGPELYLSGGYKRLVDNLAKPFIGKIKLSQVVKSINYSKRGHVQVVTNSGQRYEAPYVINTVPIGVLQHKNIQFVPRLPSSMRRAIFQDIGVGVFNKLFMLFPKVFWNKAEFIERVPAAYWNGREWYRKGRWLEFVNLDKVLHKPALVVFMTADFARKMQSKSKKELVASVMTVLRKMYGKQIPNPIHAVLTHWGTDPFSYGSYTSLRPGCMPYNRDYKVMAKPVKGRLLFAGEGASWRYPGTVHGAINSGIRAAKYVAKRLR